MLALCFTAVTLNSTVPADDLNVLRGCVSRNRAIFSPTPMVHIKPTGTWPDLIPSNKRHNKSSATSASPDVNGAYSVFSEQHMSSQYSVSIQFGSVGHVEKSLHGSQVYATSSLHRKKHRQSAESSLLENNQLHQFTSSLSGLHSPGLKPFNLTDHANLSRSSCSCLEKSVQGPMQVVNMPIVRTSSLDDQTSVQIFNKSDHGKG